MKIYQVKDAATGVWETVHHATYLRVVATDPQRARYHDWEEAEHVKQVRQNMLQAIVDAADACNYRMSEQDQRPACIYQAVRDLGTFAAMARTAGTHGYIADRKVRVRFIRDNTGIPMEAMFEGKWRRVKQDSKHGYHIHVMHTALPITIVLK